MNKLAHKAGGIIAVVALASSFVGCAFSTTWNERGLFERGWIARVGGGLS